MAKRILLYCLTAFTILSCTSATAQNRYGFDSGAIWELILDGKNIQLHILHRSGASGNLDQRYFIAVDDFPGELLLDEHQIVFLKWVQGESETTCNGFLMKGGLQMGGTFRSRNAQGAWYAYTPTHRTDQTDLDLSRRYKRSLQEKSLLIKEKVAFSAKNAELEKKLSETTHALSTCEGQANRGFRFSQDTLEKLIPKRHPIFSQVISHEFPQAPEGGFNECLSNLTNQLKQILVLGFGAENEKLCSQQVTAYCGGNLLCDIFFKQRAIYLMMGGGK